MGQHRYKPPGLGATGAYPHGKLNPGDQGELKLGVTVDGGRTPQGRRPWRAGAVRWGAQVFRSLSAGSVGVVDSSVVIRISRCCLSAGLHVLASIDCLIAQELERVPKKGVIE